MMAISFSSIKPFFYYKFATYVVIFEFPVFVELGDGELHDTSAVGDGVQYGAVGWVLRGELGGVGLCGVVEDPGRDGGRRLVEWELR